MSIELDTPVGPAELARRAMRLLAERRLPPTPSNYRLAWVEVGGDDTGCDDPVAGPAVDNDWPARIGRLVDALDATVPGWTPARKREGLRRVLATSPDAATLGQRLDKLAAAWSRPWGTLTELVPDAPSPGPEKVALPPIDPLADELAALAVQVCESLAGIARTQTWGQPLADTVRAALKRPVSAESVASASRLLRRIHAQQSELAASREATDEAIRKSLHRWGGWISDLDRTSDRFAHRLDENARKITGCDDIEEARRVVGTIVADAGSMRSEIATSRERFMRARRKVEILQERVAELQARLADASHQMLVDELTGVFNRRGLEQQFIRLERDCRLRERPLVVAMLDIDDFKRLNDDLGHQAGDAALRHLGAELSDVLGPSGAVARFGGEEFVLLLPDHDLDAADMLLSEIQGRMARAPLRAGGDARALQFSAGFGVCGPLETLELVLRRVDEALYRAKRAGKNCVRRA